MRRQVAGEEHEVALLADVRERLFQALAQGLGCLDVRGRGYAKRGLRDLCRLLLGTTPTVTLFVRTDNIPAIRLYESIGMARVLSYRSILFP